MNIFYLSPHPKIAAKWHCDKHIVKMILEYAQLLSTAHHELDGVPSIECYKSTHKNHPSAIWARENDKHYKWLWALLYETCKEYTRRYNKVHATERKGIVQNLSNHPHELPQGTAHGESHPNVCQTNISVRMQSKLIIIIISEKRPTLLNGSIAKHLTGLPRE
jgi:hypothetical protein